MNIREGNLSDIEELLKLGSRVEEFKTAEEVVTFWPRHILENILGNNRDIILVAEDDNKIVGFTIVNYSPSFKKALVENLFVDPKHRNKGIGSRLIKTLLRHLQRVGCEYVCTLIEASSGAVPFYLKMGFNRGIDCAWLDKVLSDSFKRH